MNKPMSLKIQEFQQTISQVISQSELPIYILKYQIKDLYSEIEELANNYSQQEITEYYKSLEQKDDEIKQE